MTHVPSPALGTVEDTEDGFDSSGAYTIVEEVKKRLNQLGNNIKKNNQCSSEPDSAAFKVLISQSGGALQEHINSTHQQDNPTYRGAL